MLVKSGYGAMLFAIWVKCSYILSLSLVLHLADAFIFLALQLLIFYYSTISEARLGSILVSTSFLCLPI